MNRSAAVLAGSVFLLAAVLVAFLAVRSSPRRSYVSGLAKLNIVGGAAIWVVMPLKWPHLSGEGRWLASAIADSFIAAGLLEYVALRRSVHGRRG